MKKTLVVLFTTIIFSGCSLFNQIGGAIQLSQCDYKYNSINNIQVAGITLGSTSSLSLSEIAKLSTILAGGNLQTIPFSMTLNMNVNNPNTTAAFLNALDYAIDVNGMEFTSGKLDVPFRIEPGQTSILPLSIGVDLKNLMNRYSRERVANEMGSFFGLSSEETKVTVKLWPKLMVGNTLIKVPAAIPVVFTFGGQNP